MGHGGFGTNQSVHWRIAYLDGDGDPTVTGTDPIAVDRIGRGTGGEDKKHKGFYRVRLRLTGRGAQEYLSQLANGLEKKCRRKKDDYDLEIFVPIIKRTKAQIKSGDKGPWEIRIDW